MFSNLQNKIDLKKIKEDKIEIDAGFAFKEDFDVVNQTISYFEKEKNITNNIVIKEEVTEFEDEDTFNFLDKSVEDEQKFIYNDDEMLDDIKDNVVSDEEEGMEELEESYAVYHKQRKILPLLMESANEELKQELVKYRMIDGDQAELTANEYDVEALFDKDVIDLARSEQLNQIHTVNWLSKQLVDYRKAMNDSLTKDPIFQIENSLKKLDINDTEEIKNKIKDLNESVRFLEFKRIIQEEEIIHEGAGVITWLLSSISPIFGGVYASHAVKNIVRNTLMQREDFAKKAAELKELMITKGDSNRIKELKRSMKADIKEAVKANKITLEKDGA